MKIGILQTGHTPDAMLPDAPDYDQLFVKLLDGHDFEFLTFPVVEEVFPDGPEVCDGWLITGSRYGTYEDHPWIPPLEQLIRDIYASDRPLVGVCFGHQIIAQALGGKSGKFEGGWAVGRQEYQWGLDTIALNAWHRDQVSHPPEEAEVVASNAFCENAALLYGRRAFTVQPHPEFNSAFVQGLLETRAKGLVPDDLQERARKSLTMPVDRKRVADMMALFLKEKRIA